MKKKLSQDILYVMILLIAIAILFVWYASENSRRIEERNKTYAEDSAQQTAQRIESEFGNALLRIRNFSYLLSKEENGTAIDAALLKGMEENASFDAIRFVTAEGLNLSSNGNTLDSSDREYFAKGMAGESGLEVVHHSKLNDQCVMVFYAPVKHNDQIAGILLGLYFAEDYLQNMLSTSYFGEAAGVFLCTRDGQAIASSSPGLGPYDGHLIDALLEDNVIDQTTAGQAKTVFEQGGENTFGCASECKTDNVCVVHLPQDDYVLVQTFPKTVTQDMIHVENMVGVKLESVLLTLFVCYIVSLIVRSRREKRILEKENREMGYITKGVNILFSRFAMVDLEEDTYQYLAGTMPENRNLPLTGTYQQMVDNLCSIAVDQENRDGLAEAIERRAIIASLDRQNDLPLSPRWIGRTTCAWNIIRCMTENRSGSM